MATVPVPDRDSQWRPPPSRAALSLIDQARTALRQAGQASTAAERFRLAHLAALRTAAAVYAHHARPAASRRRLVSAWVLVDAVAPEFADWSAYFAATADTRAAVEAGASGAVSERDADDQLHAAEQFLLLAEGSLDMLAALAC